MSRGSPSATPRPSATGTGAPRKSPRASSFPSATPSRCRKPSAKRCWRRPRSGAISSPSAAASRSMSSNELFENDHVKLLFLFKVSLFGTWLTDTLSKTSPMGSVIRAFDLETGYQLCQGGSFNLARGLMETFIAAGGTFAPQVAIDRILIEGGRASGIVLADGRTVRASQFVASTLDVHQTFEKSDRPRRNCRRHSCEKLDDFQYTGWTLFGLHLALHESPRFAAATFDPNINRTLKWSIGAETMEELFSAHRGRQGQPRAAHRAVRLRPVERDRSDASAARQAHHLLLARDAARARSRRPELRGLQARICREDHRDLRALLPEPDPPTTSSGSTSTPRRNTPPN